MVYFISVLVIIVCILLILVVLIQNPKGGLDSAFSTNNQVMGVRKTTDFLEKATWTMAIAIVVLSIVSSAYTNSSTSVVSEGEEDKQSKLQEQIESLPTVNNNIPVPANTSPASAEGQPESSPEE